MTTAMLDSNVFDDLEKDPATCERARALIARGLLRVVVSRTVRKELTNSRFCGVPQFFPTDYVGNTVGDVMMAVDEPIGDGKVFREHLGESRKFADAYVADAAHVHADWLVSGDKRLRTRAAAIGSGIEAMDYAGFRLRLSQMS